MGSYIPAVEQETKQMLAAVGCETTQQLFSHIPQEMIIKELKLPSGMSEMEVLRRLTEMMEKNKVFRSIFRGAGAYDHYIPAIVTSVTSKEEFVTAYTPYQAEISQGVLQNIFEYQTMICQLTGMEASNASVYDGATAAAEALAMCADRRRKKALVSAAIKPDVMRVIETYCHGSGMEVAVIAEAEGRTDMEALASMLDDGVACVYLEQPNFYGLLEDCQKAEQLVHQTKAKLILGVNPISLGILKTPGECGADIAVGEGQPLGMPLSFGGPYMGFMTCKSDMMRKLPGRIVGETADAEGKRAYVLTLQAREQHIRREKASSNVCSNQALCAMTAAVYMAAMGPEGIRQAALQSASKAAYLAKELSKIGYTRVHQGEFFNEFVTAAPSGAKKALDALADKGILGGLPLDDNKILWCTTEKNTKADMDRVVAILKEVG